jgi:phosphatidylserine/phosphatidylglycerophosphate/cardiolipin synthase-like enzyme
VDVHVIVVRSAMEWRYHGATDVAKAAIPVWIDFAPAIAHTKAIIIDGALVVGGSAARRDAGQLRFPEPD